MEEITTTAQECTMNTELKNITDPEQLEETVLKHLSKDAKSVLTNMSAMEVEDVVTTLAGHGYTVKYDVKTDFAPTGSTAVEITVRAPHPNEIVVAAVIVLFVSDENPAKSPVHAFIVNEGIANLLYTWLTFNWG